MLAKESVGAFDDPDWIFEIKWDGYRAIAEISKEGVKLYSRNGNLFNAAYPYIIQKLSEIKHSATLDGEIVVLDEEGKPNFQYLQDYENNTFRPIQYCVFDLLALDGKDICHLELLERKNLLKMLLRKNKTIFYSDHIVETGNTFFKAIAAKEMEGIVAKKSDSGYFPGRRSSEWLKIKTHKTLEALIAGFTAPRGGRKYFGALILALKKGKTNQYIGHTGTGFSAKTLQEVYQLMKPLLRRTSPFDMAIDSNAPVTWVEPQLVCEIAFSEWTKDGSLRHPVFMHMRPDKKSSQATRENIKAVDNSDHPKKTEDKEYTFGSIHVKTSHNSKLFWPDEGITKGDVITYYQEIAPVILPYLKNRPQSLKRNPNGIGDKGFYQKEAGEHIPSWLKTVKIHSESGDKDINYIICNSAASLAYLNNLGCIELNPWHSTLFDPEKPDYLIIDIDPSDKNTFDQVVEVSLVFHDLLTHVKAPHFIKTSGATGMHIYVPTGKQYSYDQLKDFSQLVCLLAQEQMPRFTTLERNLKKRGEAHIYLDHLQNRRGQTIASAYSIRPYPGATVSTPLSWKEVKLGLSPADFNIHTIPARLKKKGDLFEGLFDKRLDLKSALKKLEK
jgi:bifunctional non-homologous end joining protein LigD